MADLYTDAIQNAALTDPLRIQNAVISEFEQRLGGGDVIADPNNAFMFTLEAFSALTANAINATVAMQQRLYARRAVTMSDLFPHMSDYDYLSLYSTPVETSVVLHLDPEYLIDHAQPSPDSDRYVRVVIPDDSVFTISNMTFGIHYPINIDINKNSKAVSVSWDETDENPLYNLTQHVLEHRTVTLNQLNLISIKIPVQQFSKKTVLEDVSSTIGMTKVYTIENGSFYAARVYTVASDGTLTEMNQSLTNEVYDPLVATAVLEVLPDRNKVMVSIPQVYLDTGLVGTRVRVDLYTTMGALDVTLSTAEAAAVQTVFPSDNVYSAILTRLETLFIVPGAARIIGGSNGLSFDQLKSRVIHNSLTSGTLITTSELENYFTDQGFTVSRYQDGITNRIYRCYRVITDSTGAPLSASTLKTRLLGRNPSTGLMMDYGDYIKHDVDDSWMILPKATFKYDETGVAIPLTAAEQIALDSLTKVESVSEYNDNIYTHIPFHLKVSHNGRYPVAYSYDLFEPVVERTEFAGSNPHTGLQMSVYLSSIEHLENGTGGYQLNLEIWKSTDITSDPSTLPHSGFADVVIFLETKNEFDDSVYVRAEYVGTVNNRYIYKAVFATNYSFSTNHRIRLTDFKNVYDEDGHDFPLTMDLDVVFLMHEDAYVAMYVPPTDPTDPAYDDISPAPVISNKDTILSTLALAVHPDYYHVSKQTLTLNLGRLLAETDNPVTVSAESLAYAAYAETEYSKYIETQYERLGGVLVVNIGEGLTVSLSTMNYIGDWLFDEMVYTIHHTVHTESASAVLTGFTSVAGIEADMIVVMPGVPQGAKVVSTDGDPFTVTIDVPATATDVSDLTCYIGFYPETRTAYTVNIEIPDGESETVTITGFTSVADIEVGMLITGDLITPGARVDSVDIDNKSITIDTPMTVGGINEVVYIGWIYKYMDYMISGSTTDGVTTLSGFEDLTYIYPGMCVTIAGADMPLDARVYSVDRDLNTIVIDVELDPLGVNIVRCRIGWPVILHEVGDPLLYLDTKLPVLDGGIDSRQLTYDVDAIHVDAKFDVSELPEHDGYTASIVHQLKGYFAIVASAKIKMLENTELYFHPICTIGTAPFTQNGTYVLHDLQLIVSLNLYVEPSVYTDESLRATIKQSILKIIDDELTDGTISCAKIASTILSQMSDNVKYVDVLGINGENTKQTLIGTVTSAVPSLKHQLVYNVSTGELTIERGLLITWYSV